MKNIFKSISRYFKGVKKEVSRIRWTTPKDLIKYSVTVVLFMLFLGLYFYGIDWIITLVRGAM
ncbi:MAG: preprotein translocase subunit SecE [Bacilli bacterium]|nr:preprotein translocase subunit SecE [Bacilli bacterium]